MFTTNYAAQTSDIAGKGLYNGNISSGTLAISSLNSGSAIGFSYGYDQLNRIKTVNRHPNISGSWNSGSSSNNYREQFAYDANGNIKPRSAMVIAAR